LNLCGFGYNYNRDFPLKK